MFAIICVLDDQTHFHDKWENTVWAEVQQRGDLWVVSGIDRKGSEREVSNGFSVKDSPQEASVFVLLNGFGPSGSHQVSCQNFNKLRGLQLGESFRFPCSLFSVLGWIFTTFADLTSEPSDFYHANKYSLLSGTNHVLTPPVGCISYCTLIL